MAKSEPAMILPASAPREVGSPPSPESRFLFFVVLGMSRLFAVVPAAGLSRRMGRPKLTLPVQGETLIARLLKTLTCEEIHAAVVIVRRQDDELQQQVQQTTAKLVLPETDPPDMRASVQYGLQFLQEEFSPADEDGWLLMPADHPLLDRKLLLSLIHHWQHSDAEILVPVLEGKRGHPTFFRWSLMPAVFQLPENCGLNVLLQQFADKVQEVPVTDRSVLTDLDTPADWEHLQRLLKNREKQ